MATLCDLFGNNCVSTKYLSPQQHILFNFTFVMILEGRGGMPNPKKVIHSAQN